MQKIQSLQQMVPDIHMENNDIGSLPTYPTTKINSNSIDDLNVTMDILNSKETWGKLHVVRSWQ